MTDPSLALQAMIRARLSADAGVTALVPAANILDRNHRPEIFPSVILGEGQSLFGDFIQDSYHDTAFTDLHIWVEEVGLAGGKAIAGTVRDALRNGPWDVAGHVAVNVRLVSARYMRDPDGMFSHTILTVEALLLENPTNTEGSPSPSGGIGSYYYLGF